MTSAGKRKREDLPSQYRGRGYIPQRDGAGDAMSDDFQVVFLFFCSFMYILTPVFRYSPLLNTDGRIHIFKILSTIF